VPANRQLCWDDVTCDEADPAIAFRREMEHS
jgi:hypothetical protein